MRYGELVTLQSTGVGLRATELDTVGIYPNSACWGVWLPNHDAPRGQSGTFSPRNLLISALHPTSWPVLVRVQLRLYRDPSAIERAAALLADEGLNLLSYDCTPSGYHHLTWTIVGEYAGLAYSTTSERSLIDQYRVRDRDRTLRNPRIWAFTNGKLAPAMLKFCHGLEKRLLAEGRLDLKDGGFLHGAFVGPPRAFGGLIYDPERLPADIQATGHRQVPQPVSCRWLQGMAFFWLYGHGVADPMAFKYSARTSFLKPDDASRDAFVAGLGELGDTGLPMRTLALFDTADQYLRILLAPEDVEERVAKLDIEYVAKLTKRRPTTKGLFVDVLRELAKTDLSVRHITNRCIKRLPKAETNVITVIGVTTKKTTPARLNTLKDNLEAAPRKSYIEKLRVSASPVARYRLFISMRFDWNRYEALRRPLVDAARSYGFEARISDGRTPVEAGGDQVHGITAEVWQTVMGSHAFLQITPFSEDQDARWLNFEFGLALGRNIPFALCVETGTTSSGLEAGPDGGQKVATDWRKFTFDKDDPQDVVIGRLGKALAYLITEVRRLEVTT